MPKAPVFTIKAGRDATATTEVKKSRFIARLAPATTPEDARAIIDEEKRAYPDARHHCSAFVLESNGATLNTHSSDDGEPSGTAGAPILEVLTGANLINVVAVVTRYFGGTLLGTGGLVRAYAGATQQALTAARADLSLVRLVDLPRFTAIIPLEHAGRTEAEIRNRDWRVLGAVWAGNLTIDFATPIGDEGEVAPLIAALTCAEPQVSRTGTIRQQVTVS